MAFKKALHFPILMAIGSACVPFSGFAAPAEHSIRLVPIGTYESGIFAAGAAEIVAHDPLSQRLFVVNAKAASLDVLDISDPMNPTKVDEASLLPFGGVANSVAVRDGLVAVAVESIPKTSPGFVVFFDTDLNFVNSVQVGSLPDMVTFSPNGRWVLAANEAEPNSYNNANSANDWAECGSRRFGEYYRSFRRSGITHSS